MHGVTGKPPEPLGDADYTKSRAMLLLLVAMTAIATISLFLVVPALPMIATRFGGDISTVQMTISVYMVGLAFSQLIMGPLSDRFGRRPVLLGGMSLMVVASIGSIFADTLPQLIAARFLQAFGAASGMVISRAIIRDLYSRDRVGAMISLVTAAMMVTQMLSPMIGSLLETGFGWRAIFYAMAGASLLITVAIAVALPETWRAGESVASGFRGDARSLFTSRAFIGYALCQALTSSVIFTFAGGGPYVVITQMGRSAVEYGAWYTIVGFAFLIGNLCCVRFAPRHSLEKLIWFGLLLQLAGGLLNLAWGLTGLSDAPSWLFSTQMLVSFAVAFVTANSAAGAISVRPKAAGTAAGIMGFLQLGLGAICAQLGAYLGGHFTTAVPLNLAMLALSIAAALTMILLVPRRELVVSEELMEQAEDEKSGLL